MSSSTLRLIASHYLLTPQGFYSQPLITIDAQSGEIIKLEQYDQTLDSHAGVEFYPGILCRGFVNAHCHSELSYLRGAIPQGVGYSGFAATMARVRGNFSEQERADALIAADQEMWQGGVDFCADIVNDHSSFAVKSNSLIHYHSFAEVFGLKQSNLERCQEIVNQHPNTTLTLHSTYSVQQSDFEAVCNSKAPLLSIHFKESLGEEQLYQNAGALAEWYQSVGFECDFLNFNSPAERIVKSIPKNQSVIFVHNSYLTEDDINLIMSHFTAPVYWVLCPRSNRYISGSITDAAQLLIKHGLNILIGTDSLASNSSLSIIEELKCFSDIPLHTLLSWATTNGYAAFGYKPRGWINIVGADLENMLITEQTEVKRVL